MLMLLFCDLGGSRWALGHSDALFAITRGQCLDPGCQLCLVNGGLSVFLQAGTHRKCFALGLAEKNSLEAVARVVLI